jgi:hypothetical protein
MKTIKITGLMSLILAVAFLFPSCKKDDDKLTNLEILTTDAVWKIVGLTSNPPVPWYGEEPVTDIFAVLEDCLKDDLMIFQANGILKFDEGVKKCPEGQEISSAEYTIDDAQTLLTVKYDDGDIQKWTIKSITEDKLVLTYVLKDDETNVNHTFTATFDKL